jgi:hypothetical protein
MESRVSLEFRHLPKRVKHHANSQIDNGGRPSLEATPFVAIIRGTFDILSTTYICTTYQKYHGNHHVRESYYRLFRTHCDPERSIHDEKQMDDARCMEDYNDSLF